MPAPALTHTGQRLYDSLAPLAYDDENQGFALAYLCSALASMIDEIADLSRDTETDDPGYSPLFDLDNVAEDYLPYIGQFIGVSVPGHLSDAGKRLRIRETDGFRRGSPGAIKGAARQQLTGTKSAFLVERHGGAYQLTVSTYTSETPDPVATQTAIAAQIPAGIIFNYALIAPSTFNALRDSHSDFAHVAEIFFNCDEIIVNPTKTWDYAALHASSATYAALELTYTDYTDLKTPA